MKSPAPLTLFALMVMMFLPMDSYALRVGDVNVPDTAEVAGEKLVLNGAGFRKKFIIKVYVGALYLTQKAQGADAVASMPGAKRITSQFVYKHVSKEKLDQSWKKGIAQNNPDGVWQKMRERTARLSSFFTDMKEGDSFAIDFIPSKGVEVYVNGQLKGSVEGDDFARALLNVWIGPSPPDDDLKKAMLGY